MKIKVEDQARTFYMATFNKKTKKYEWFEVAGHGISIGEYDFFITILEGKGRGLGEINITEVTTGMSVFKRKANFFDFVGTETVGGFVRFATREVGKVADYIKENKEVFEDRLAEERGKFSGKLGDRPESRLVSMEELEGDSE